jgi:hypothetical protein
MLSELLWIPSDLAIRLNSDEKPTNSLSQFGLANRPERIAQFGLAKQL